MSLDMIVYRQAQKERDGRIIYKGEDTLPYVDDNIILVADGLGGAAAIRHQSFNKDMFDEDKIFDVLFDGVFDMRECDWLKEYVQGAFFEFTSIKDCYFDNVNNIKKSGYFASRIASAIFLYLAKNLEKNTGESFDKIFDELSSPVCDKAKTNEICAKLCKYFSETLKEKLLKTSENANLVYETTFKNIALLGTTLCATITKKDVKKKCVYALYFTAGDSRPYVWDRFGLRQVCADQERADGGMTNYIKANGDFEIKCEYREFYYKDDYGVVLFNASDGIFDSKAFKKSQMGLEKLIVDTISDSDAIETVADQLEDFFVDNGTHDDSSTIALKVFGFNNSYEKLRTKAKSRRKELDRDYLQHIPDVYEHDYSADLNADPEKVRSEYLRRMAIALWDKEYVKGYYKLYALNKLKEESEEFRALQARIDEFDKIRNSIKLEMAGLIENSPKSNKKAPMIKEKTKAVIEKLLKGEITVYSLKNNVAKQELDTKANEYRKATAEWQKYVIERDDAIERYAVNAWLEFCSGQISSEKVVEHVFKNCRTVRVGGNGEKIRIEMSKKERVELLKRYPEPEPQKIAERAIEQNALLKEYDRSYYALIKEQE